MNSKVKVAVVFLGPHCNMKCPFCITEDNFEFIPRDEACALLRRLKDEFFTSVVLGGGEPFLWPHGILDLIREAKALELKVQIGTNATVFPEDLNEFNDVDRWVLPLESMDPAIHDSIRPYRKSHHAIMLQRIKSLIAARQSMTFSTILTTVNTSSVPRIAEFLRKIQQDTGLVHAWHLYRYLPFGRGGAKNASWLDPGRASFKTAWQTLVDLRLPFKIFRRSDMYSSRVVEFFWFARGIILRSSNSRLTAGYAGEIRTFVG